MRYAWTLLLAGALSLGLAGAALAAPDGFKEHKLPGLAIDLPSDWQIAPKEALAQVQKQAGDMKVLLMAQSPEVPQFAIMEQPVGEMDQAAFAKLDEDGQGNLRAGHRRLQAGRRHGSELRARNNGQGRGSGRGRAVPGQGSVQCELGILRR